MLYSALVPAGGPKESSKLVSVAKPAPTQANNGVWFSLIKDFMGDCTITSLAPERWPDDDDGQIPKPQCGRKQTLR